MSDSEYDDPKQIVRDWKRVLREKKHKELRDEKARLIGESVLKGDEKRDEN